MNQQLFVGSFNGTLGAALTSGATSATLATGFGAKLPTLSNGDYVLLTLTQAGPVSSETSWEVVKVTAVSGDTITITRAIEGTAAAWASGDKCELRVPATTLNGLTALGTNRTAQALGSVSGTVTVDLNGAGTISLTVGGVTTLAFTNTPALGTTIEKTFYITNGGAFTLNYPSGSRFFGPGIVGTAPTLVTSGVDVLRVKSTNFAGTVTHDWAYIGRVA